MITKALTIEQMDEAGKGRARIAQLSAVDSDGDTYAPGAFSWAEGGGQWVTILPAHDRRAMPLGKAWVFEEGDWAFADLHMNLETQSGRDWHQALKFDLATGKPVQEWSYGFDVLDADIDQRGRDWSRKLKKLKVDEVSPVLRGAGVGTGTISMKSAAMKEAHFTPLIASLGELADALPEDAGALSATGLKQLEQIGAAIETVLATAGKAAAGDGLEDAALAAYMKHLSRRHLAQRPI